MISILTKKLLFFLLGTALAGWINAQSIVRIYYNGNLITMDSSVPVTEALAVDSDGLIAAIGSNSDILLLAEESTLLINMNGKTMLPGFNDSHSHWFSWREHICESQDETTFPPLKDIMQTLSRNGWTSISELNMGRPDNSSNEHLANALDLEARGELSVRVNGYWGSLNDGGLLEALSAHSMVPGHYYSDRIHTPGVKIYVDDPFGTTNILTQEEVTAFVTVAHTNGWQVAAHVVNESAAEMILNAYETVLGAESNENYRHRIEHAVKISDAQLERMKNKGIIASFQLVGPPDWPEQETFQTYLSNTHPEWCLRWKDFMEAEVSGLKVTGSSDAPFNEMVCDPNPFRAIYQSATRMGYLERTHASWELSQRISIEEGLTLLTIHGAYATFEEELKGSLTAGKYADMVIVSHNPYELSDPEDLLNIEVLMTMVGGRIEFCQSGYEDLCDGTAGFFINDANITSSAFLPGNTPDLVFDNNTETFWSSGDMPPQWIQIDLQKELYITKIELLTDQYPEGYTVHQLMAKAGSPSEYSIIQTFSGITETNQMLTYDATAPFQAYRYIRVETSESPSWVAWREIIIHNDITGIHESAESSVNEISDIQITPNPADDNAVLSYSIHKTINVKIRLASIDGKINTVILNNAQIPGYYSLSFINYLPNGIKAGMYLLVIETPKSTVIQKVVIPGSF